MKKLIYLGLAMCMLTACGQSKETNDDVKNFNELVQEKTQSSEAEVEQEEPVEDTPEENTDEEDSKALFDAFCSGQIDAECISSEDGSSWSMSADQFSFPGQSDDDFDATSMVTIEDPLDLDNDGEVEYILHNDCYGDMCFDCKDGKVICFAQGEGTTAYCSYSEVDGEYWIIHSDTSHSGRVTYDLKKYNGNLEVVDSFTFGWEDWDEDGVLSYYKDDQEISESEYDDLLAKYTN